MYNKKKSGVHLVCLVRVSQWTWCQKWGSAHASVRRPEVVSGILVLVSLIKCTPIELVCLWWLVEFFLTFVAATSECVFFAGYNSMYELCPLIEPRNARGSCSTASDESRLRRHHCRPLIYPIPARKAPPHPGRWWISSDYFRLAQVSSAGSGKRVCWFCYWR